MKLNKNGWGLRTMLILSGVIILFLGVAIYFISRIYSGYDEEILNHPYRELENNLEKQASIYLNDYYDDMLTNEKITITRGVLRSYDLDINLKDPYDEDCSGYAVASKSKGITNIKAYIKCKRYETKGYEEWRS